MVHDVQRVGKALAVVLSHYGATAIKTDCGNGWLFLIA